ncbi:uncharacterized protein LOC127854298 isoform X2 [Dreissena polymorpha]|uniref:uncharacterized protein LOC127854298 isoform X2 n=1 Tax=Dreissena polymorpha TaxID=45954 RepID=UPI002263D0EE|nr:uncharacterized protein LOC127854298 isoform X2 [Dreissena polymorpha]
MFPQTRRTKTVVECSVNHGDDQSRHLFKLLDYVGYSHDIIAERRRVFHGIDSMINNAREDKIVRVTAGSKAEGLASCYESDYDFLNIYQNIVCQFEIFTNIFSNDTTEFCMLGEACHPGYYTLKLLTRGVKLPIIIEASLVTNQNYEIFISSDLFTKEFEQTVFFDSVGGWNKGKRTGPAVPSTRGIYRRDNVYAFRCVVQKEVLADWAKRERPFGWPCADVINDVINLDAQLVPVGCKGSSNRDMEWRICFIYAELKLIEHLNECQYKLYILLKSINKEVFHPICSDISSFIMKNVAFWTVESHHQEIFREQNLMHVLQIALKFLKTALVNNNLPYYMIHGRDLLIGRTTENERSGLISKLEELITEDGRIIYRLPKLRKAVDIVPPDELEQTGKRRDKLERLELTRQYIHASYRASNLQREEIDVLCWNDKLYREARYEMYDMVWPQWRDYLIAENRTETLNTVIQSIGDAGTFRDHYLRFSHSNLSIVWPHLKSEVKVKEDTAEDLIMELFAILRVKIERDLS